jgi:nucleoside 2-deoxyribosyltransferase
MKIVICCSVKYIDTIRATIDGLNSLGLQGLFSNLDYEDENTFDVIPVDEMKRLASEHYALIDEADIVYFITPDGYMGTSCKLELGYAVAKGKPIYFSEPTNDYALDCYVTKFIPTNSLNSFLELQ